MKRKHSLITGGSKSLGRAIAIKFAQNNINIGIIGRDENGLTETKNQVENFGVKCLVIKTDLCKESDLHKAVTKALIYSKTWDILVNNTGWQNKLHY